MTPDNGDNTDNGGDEICIAIDPGRVNPRSLELAVLLAEHFRRGLRGLVVTRSSLHAVAQLPFTTEVVRTTGEERELLADVLAHKHRLSLAQVQRLLEESAARRRIRCRFEPRPEEEMPLSTLVTERRDLFLPAMRRPFVRGGDNLGRIKWVYDGSEQSERALALVRQLVASGQTRSLFLIATGAVPRNLLAELSATGVRVYWVTARDDEELLARIRSSPEAGLTLAPAGLMEGVGEARLTAITRELASPLLIVA